MGEGKIRVTKRSTAARQSSDTIQDELRRLHTVDRMTWREIAALPQYSGIPPGTLCGIVTQGYIPPKWHHQLGLPTTKVTLTPVNGTPITPGAQVLDCRECVRCGRAFVPNTAKRRRCYDCTQARRRK